MDCVQIIGLFAGPQGISEGALISVMVGQLIAPSSGISLPKWALLDMGMRTADDRKLFVNIRCEPEDCRISRLARYRKRANTELRLVVLNGAVVLGVYSTCLIEEGTEIFLPWK